MIVGEPHFKYRGDGTFEVTKGFMGYYDGYEAYVVPGTITNFPSFGLARIFFNPNDERFVFPATIHDALVGEYGDPIKIRNMKTGEYKQADWELAAKWFKHELKNSGCNKYLAQLFYGFVMAWKKFR